MTVYKMRTFEKDFEDILVMTSDYYSEALKKLVDGKSSVKYVSLFTLSVRTNDFGNINNHGYSHYNDDCYVFSYL